VLYLERSNFWKRSGYIRHQSLFPSIFGGLCVVFMFFLRIQQLKFAYTPTGNFCLRDFHHAINSLPLDAFVPEIDESGAISCRGLSLPLFIYLFLHSFLVNLMICNHTKLFIDLKLSSVLCDRALYSWGGRDIMRKVIVLSSCFPEDMDSEAKNTLMVSQICQILCLLVLWLVILVLSLFASGCNR